MIRLVVLFAVAMVSFHLAAAQPQIFTTLRGDANATVWDGKWTFMQEWKRTSEDIVRYSDGNELAVKTGHDRQNLYVFLDFFTEHQFTKYADYGLVCIVTNETTSPGPDENYHCFLVSLGSHHPVTLQSGGDLAMTNHLTRIKNDNDLIGVGGISDSHDRYSYVPHPSYEFKIPIGVIGRSDHYRFYAAAYDARDGSSYSWPQNITKDSFPSVPPISRWGDLISPDKTLPEFPYPVITLLVAVLVITLLSRKTDFSIGNSSKL